MPATVIPPPFKAPRCAAASMPTARPLTTTTPTRASSSPSCSATASPYGEGRREPTIATRGPSGGGHRPRVLSSGSDILQPETERLEDVVFCDLFRAVEVGRGARHPPRPMEASRRHAALRRPTLERAARWRRKAGQLAEACRLELRVERPLPVQLPAACHDHALAHPPRGLAVRLRGQRFDRHPAHRDLEVDPVEQRTREPALVRVDGGPRAAAHPHPVSCPPAWTRVRRRHP